MNLQQRVDLTNCDREPIHLPGSIQPHGCLIACDSSLRTVLRHSANTSDILGVDIDINGQPLEKLVGQSAVHAIRNGISRTTDASRPALLFSVPIQSGKVFDVAIHGYRSTAIVEFEPAEAGEAQPVELARTMIGRIITIDSVETLVRDTARLVRGMLGYDRVMVYKFGQDGSGKVISESKRPDLESFLGQYFPATDIPQQARKLYLRNTIRIISDIDCDRVPLVPVLDASGEPLDLSFAHLRSVSPVHCEYLRNMGVGASMSISIVLDGELWGLIACHHYGKRTLSMAERAAAEMFGEFFSLHLNALRQQQKLTAATSAKQALNRFLRLSTQAGDIATLMRNNLPDFASLIACDGAGIWLQDQWISIGVTPPAKEIADLAAFANTVSDGEIWATHALTRHLPEAARYAAQAAGVLLVPLSQRPRDYLMFFRREVVQTLDWAGNPDKSYESGPLGDRLTPRKSFAIWKETVHQQCAPWTEEEREIAEGTRVALVEVVLHQNELLEDERAKADVRQRMLNEELNHRVKNILAVIKSLVVNPSRDGQTLEDYVDSLRGRIQALAFAHDQVVRGDGGGSLTELINAELTPYCGEMSGITVEGPSVWLDTRAFSVMALILHELSTNAAKYGALSRDGGRLVVRWDFDRLTGCKIEWIESGGPPVKPPQRRGFGSVLIGRSVPFDLGGESDVDYRPEGLRAQFRIPPKYASAAGLTTNPAARQSKAASHEPATLDLSQVSALLVEDQMLIAIDLEQMLFDAGFRQVVTAASTTEALDRLQTFTPDIAFLDVNLGVETSEVVADELSRRGVPFSFATGYGDGSIIPQKFERVPVVRKPYEQASILAQVTRLLVREHTSQ